MTSWFHGSPFVYQLVIPQPKVDPSVALGAEPAAINSLGRFCQDSSQVSAPDGKIRELFFGYQDFYVEKG
jgi:hypothetical protein